MRVGWGTTVVVAVALAAAGSSGARPVADAQWTTYGHDDQLSGFTFAGTFTAGAKRFSQVWTAKLDGGLVAQPLAAPLAGHGLVFFAATEGGGVYAIDGSSGAVIWHVPVGTVAVNGNCGTWGVSSTPVIDSARGLLYVIGSMGVLHAFRLTDGKEALGFPVRVTSRRRTEYVWGALRLVGNRLYMGVASYCDAPDTLGHPAEGRLLAFDVSKPSAPPATYDPVPGMDNLGGIWGWGGVAVTPAGDALYSGVGNAEPDVDNGASDSMVELVPDLSETIAVNRPIGTEPGKDTDLGAAPVLFQPTGCPPLLAANDKSGDLVVWRQNALGLGLYARIPLSDGEDAFVGAPSWSPKTQMLYDGGATFEKAGKRLVGTIALKVTAACRFAARWSTPTGDGSQPQPLVAGDLVVSTGGSNGGIVVSRASTGVVVWKFATSAPTLSPPMEAGGLLVFGDMSGRLYAFRPTG